PVFLANKGKSVGGHLRIERTFPIAFPRLRLQLRRYGGFEYLRGQCFQPRLGLTRGNAALRAADDTERSELPRFAANDLFRADRHIQIPIAAHVNARESRLEHAQNFDRVTVERDGLAHHIGTAPVLLLPETIT